MFSLGVLNVSSFISCMHLRYYSVNEIFFPIIGQTTNDDWNNNVKNKPAPWAEIEIPGQFILTVPSSKLVSITDLNAVANIYQSIILAENKLAGLEKRFRPERFVFDIQISGGNVFKFFTVTIFSHLNVQS
jgi:hypothetical protein